MKCKICGAELRTEGDICKNCYAEMLEYEELEKDKKIIYKIKPKFIPIYEILNKGELLLIGIILVWNSFNKMMKWIIIILFKLK